MEGADADLSNQDDLIDFALEITAGAARPVGELALRHLDIADAYEHFEFHWRSLGPTSETRSALKIGLSVALASHLTFASPRRRHADGYIMPRLNRVGGRAHSRFECGFAWSYRAFP